MLKEGLTWGVIKTGVNQECGRALGVVAPAIGNANVQTRSFKFGFQSCIRSCCDCFSPGIDA